MKTKKQHKRKPTKEEKIYIEFVKWCFTQCKDFKKRLHITSYIISMDTTPVKTPEEFDFEIHMGTPYHHARIAWTEQAFCRWKEGRLEEVGQELMHEMIHILVGKLAIKAENRWESHAAFRHEIENLTDHLTRIIYYKD